MKTNCSAREKWFSFLKGEDVGPMVSPLCDNWALDIPYHWPYDTPEPLRADHPQHILCQQMAMAKICGWDPTFLAGIPFPPRNPDLHPRVTTTKIEGGSRIETRFSTPHGDLASIVELKATAHTVKAELATEEDYRRKIWLVRAQMDYDEDASIRDGQEFRKAMGDRGILGYWFGPPAGAINRDEMFYHLADWPDACAELHAVTRSMQFKQIETLRKAGYDYLFYCVDGTEWISPDFFAQHLLADIQETFRRWRAMGGAVLWHSCGRISRLVERGFYNECLPDIFETLSEPPVGDLPSLKWARERLDRRIATKGNIPLNVLLHGSQEEVRAEVRRVREQTRGYRHIVGLSDDVLADTPLANIKAFVDEARKP